MKDKNGYHLGKQPFYVEFIKKHSKEYQAVKDLVKNYQNDHKGLLEIFDLNDKIEDKPKEEKA